MRILHLGEVQIAKCDRTSGEFQKSRTNHLSISLYLGSVTWGEAEAIALFHQLSSKYLY
ncbi:MAG: hypothetical protein KME06_08790 [Kastovskya adunca ATA6-11-RM4]|nr:hypothetical protein [Kastovskya adunca ATA6-11-RM4]